ncbi:MAG: 16S rRNA (adenine(1518)-N(6)/adenine(1519)-N(6))-dimethyltransferase RsmA [Syntrophales bacterium]|nr:16S rRNA (adenine(1518)-N(6)/adenine(1519)-N(6))-dimethyltransferase RsmA [Syntrophales bacterium]
MSKAFWYPRKKWGQSFLHDPNIVRKIVDWCDLNSDEVVVEIGPGRGALTFSLAERVRKLIAVEIDPYLAQTLREKIRGSSPVEVVEGDILSFDFTSCARNWGAEKIKVVGNIPYSISGPILFYLLAARNIVSTAVLMVQKEVAERLTAKPGNREYGFLTVMFSTYGRVVKAFTVAANCFYPRPRVTSAVVRIDFSPHPPWPIIDEEHFQRLVKRAFAHKRKTLLNNLLMNYSYDASKVSDLLRELGLNTRSRAEVVNPVQFIQLSNALISLRKE